MRKPLRPLVAALSLLGLAACGGGFNHTLPMVDSTRSTDSAKPLPGTIPNHHVPAPTPTPDS